MKKLLIVGVFVFAFALAITPALAYNMPTVNPCCDNHDSKTCCPVTTVNNNNNATVNNTVKSLSNTGLNMTTSGKTVSWFGMGGGSITTGLASAVAGVENQVGSNDTTINGITSGTVTVNNSNSAGVNNYVSAVANTGKNMSIGGSITSGAAGSQSTALNMIGFNVTKIGM